MALSDSFTAKETDKTFLNCKHKQDLNIFLNNKFHKF